MGRKIRGHAFFLKTGIIWTFIINALLIIVVNPGILNPGPNKLSVVYQNVQGLIPFSDLGLPNPRLDRNKLIELHGHVNVKTFNKHYINYLIEVCDGSPVGHTPD